MMSKPEFLVTKDEMLVALATVLGTISSPVSAIHMLFWFSKVITYFINPPDGN